MAEETMPHKLCLENRQKLTMNAVTEVVSFDETMVVLHTSQGVLVVQGEQLRLKNLSPEGGKVEVDGQIAALHYEQPRQKRSWRSLLQ